MNKTRKLFIVGDSAFAEVAYECFTWDSTYEVVGFAVERDYLRRDDLFGLPVVPLDECQLQFDIDTVEFYAAVVYTNLNRLRTRLYESVKALGYRPASYVSSRASVWHNAKIGEHCFVFEDNTVQPFVTIGRNVVLWSGNHIGHHSVIQDHCFISSHVVVSGFCNIGAYSFLGVNATLGNNVSIGEDNWIGLGATIVRDTEQNSLFKGIQSEPAKISARRFFKVAED